MFGWRQHLTVSFTHLPHSVKCSRLLGSVLHKVVMWLLSLSPTYKEILEPYKSSLCPGSSHCGLQLLCFISDLFDALEFFGFLPLTSSYIGQFYFMDGSLG